MIATAILEGCDIVEAEDYVRQLSLIFTGQSDYLETTSTYGGGAVNRLGWIKVKHFCPAWVGKTVDEFHDALVVSRTSKRHEVEMCYYEFIRGEIPRSHEERLSKDQLRIAEMIWANRSNNHTSLEDYD